LKQEYSVGLFNVTVVAQRKPLLQQSFLVTLGTKKPLISPLLADLDRLSQRFIRDIAAAQTNLRNITTSVSKGLHGAIVKFEDGALSTLEQTRYWGRHMQERTQTVAEHLLQAKDEAARQSDKGAQVIKDVSEAVSEALQKSWHAYSAKASELVENLSMPDMWDQARPSVSRARKNAVKIQKKLQKKGKVDGQETETKKDAKASKRRSRQGGRGKK
jgi:hypothetical protein